MSASDPPNTVDNLVNTPANTPANTPVDTPTDTRTVDTSVENPADNLIGSDSEWETYSSGSSFSLSSISDSPTVERIRNDPPVRSPFFQSLSDYCKSPKAPVYPSGYRIGQNPQGLQKYIQANATRATVNESIASPSTIQSPPHPKAPMMMNTSSVGASKGESSRADGAATQHHQRFPPGSFENPPNSSGETQIMTDSMLRAYVAMRGPQGTASGVYGPLANYMKLLHDDANDVSGMDSPLATDYTGGVLPRSVAFEIPKATGPVKYPAGFAWDDSDDEEGANPSGRITAETFLAFAEGASRWDHSDTKDPDGVLDDAVRTRPEKPTALSTNDHFPAYLDKVQAQVDQNTGEDISPAYVVPASPSLIWTPPGVTDNAHAPGNFLERYSRMAPREAMKRINDHYSHGKVVSVPPAGTNENYSKTEVQQVANKLHGEELGPHLPEFMGLQYNTIANYELQDVTLTKQVAAQDDQIAALEKEREQLKFWYIPALQQLRAERARRHALSDAEKKKQREGRIQEHIANHIRDAQYRLDRACVRVTELQHKYAENAAYIAALQQEIGEACLLVGKETPQEVYDEVNGPESPVPASAASTHVQHTWSPQAGQSTVKQSSVTQFGDDQKDASSSEQLKSRVYGDLEEGPSTQKQTAINKLNVDEYIEKVLGSQKNRLEQDNKHRAAADPSTLRPRSLLYGNQEDAYGSSKQTSPFVSDNYGNVGPSIQSTTSKWSVVNNEGNGAGATTTTGSQQQTPLRQLRRSRRDVSDSSYRGPLPKSPEDKGKGKEKEVARDATSGATSSSWDTEIF
ncbi:hypothetical protein K449DRAFT_398625 [Hypoxylon sp. EC38]|nr:hypothetical protein K449DRAFT_398625 [Hypoxylon sp. EC38]